MNSSLNKSSQKKRRDSSPEKDKSKEKKMATNLKLTKCLNKRIKRIKIYYNTININLALPSSNKRPF